MELSFQHLNFSKVQRTPLRILYAYNVGDHEGHGDGQSCKRQRRLASSNPKFKPQRKRTN